MKGIFSDLSGWVALAGAIGAGIYSFASFNAKVSMIENEIETYRKDHKTIRESLDAAKQLNINSKKLLDQVENRKKEIEAIVNPPNDTNSNLYETSDYKIQLSACSKVKKEIICLFDLTNKRKAHNSIFAITNKTRIITENNKNYLISMVYIDDKERAFPNKPKLTYLDSVIYSDTTVLLRLKFSVGEEHEKIRVLEIAGIPHKTSRIHFSNISVLEGNPKN